MLRIRDSTSSRSRLKEEFCLTLRCVDRVRLVARQALVHPHYHPFVRVKLGNKKLNLCNAMDFKKLLTIIQPDSIIE